MSDEEPRLTNEDARAGATPHIARYVLGISLAAIIILFAILLISYH